MRVGYLGIDGIGDAVDDVGHCSHETLGAQQFLPSPDAVAQAAQFAVDGGAALRLRQRSRRAQPLDVGAGNALLLPHRRGQDRLGLDLCVRHLQAGGVVRHEPGHLARQVHYVPADLIVTALVRARREVLLKQHRFLCAEALYPAHQPGCGQFTR